MCNRIVRVGQREWAKLINDDPGLATYEVDYDARTRECLIRQDCPALQEGMETGVKFEIPERIKDSGSRTTFETGAVRDVQKGKGRRDLLPMRALLELSQHYEHGSYKYPARNWEKGIELHTFVNSAMHHLFLFLIGRKEEPHLVAAAWNIMGLIDTIIRIKEGLLPESLNTLPINLDEINMYFVKEENES